MTESEERAMREKMAPCSEFLRFREDILRLALESFARNMSESERAARDAYEAGQADSAVKARQDASQIGNRGYGFAADMFKANAEAALSAAEDMWEVLHGSEAAI
ncbi:hypothetical protein [Streptomyces sp. NPDC051662]|uniref:hypothetical protein n=1 Tax=Streptomyces sp. NPDC051662 TaxID=3154750 RepID=UPI003437A366